MTARAGIERVPMSKAAFFHETESGEAALVDWEDGVAIRMTPAHGRHGTFISYLHVGVDTFLKVQRMGRAWAEIFVDFGPKAYGTDLAVLFTDHVNRYQDGRIQGTPDIVVEVISADSESRDRTVKFDTYLQFGVPWYWIGDPVAATLEEYHLTPEGYLRIASGSVDEAFCPRAIPGLVIDMSELMDIIPS